MPGFESYLDKISEEELSMIPAMVKGFESKIGKENAVTSSVIIKSYALKGIKLRDARIRRMVHYIRKHHLPNLIASSTGYYITNNPQELREYVISIDKRIGEIQSTRNLVNNYLQKLTTGMQTTLNPQ